MVAGSVVETVAVLVDSTVVQKVEWTVALMAGHSAE